AGAGSAGIVGLTQRRGGTETQRKHDGNMFPPQSASSQYIRRDLAGVRISKSLRLWDFGRLAVRGSDGIGCQNGRSRGFVTTYLATNSPCFFGRRSCVSS